MPVGGDPSAMRGLQGGFTSAASDGAGQGSALAGVMGALGPGNLAGSAGDQWRSYVSELQRANAAMTRAYDAMASLLPRVAAAVEEAQLAEQAKIKAAEAEQHAAQQLNTATANLQFLTELNAPPLVVVPPAELQAAEAAVALATHAFEDAQHRLQVTTQHFNDADRRRRALLEELTAVCRAQAAALMAAMPPASPPTPYLFQTQALISELQAVRTDMLDIPTIAGSWVAPALLPKLRSIFSGRPSALPGLTPTVEGLYNVAQRPLSAYVPRHSGGSLLSSVLKWGGVVGVTAVGVLAIGAASMTGQEEADAPITEGGLSLARSLLDNPAGQFVRANGLAIGTGGLSSEGFTALDDVIHHQSVDPKGLIIAGSTGWVSGALPVGISSKFLEPAVHGLAPVLAARAATGAATAAGLSAASQYVLFHRIDPASTAVAAGGGLWGGAWSLPESLTGPSMAAKWALAQHQGGLPGFTLAATDHAGTAPAHPARHALPR